MHGDKNKENFQKKLAQQIHYGLNSLFTVRHHEIATSWQIDECHERGIRFDVTDKCAIYLLIEITWLSGHNIDAKWRNGKFWFKHAIDRIFADFAFGHAQNVR